ncbi:MAG: VanW family protein, partial [Acidaminococcaceae bacterium]|nr:VanW family protein [Acidaminococcaceae bacterium]
SYNGVVGQRTEARGYLPAPAYVAGETVDELGGGVCQPSSTLYLACLLADMEIVERTNHRYVPAYIDWGMDATVSWGTLDYKFSNNTPYPVKIVTTYENNYLTVKLLGTNDTGKHAAMTNKVISETPWETIYVDDPTMAPGSPDVVKTTPYVGYKVEAYHTIYDADGKVISQHLESVNNYKVRNKVVLRAPALPADAELPTTPSVPTVNDQPIEEPSWNPIQESPAPQGPDGDFSDFLDEGSYGIL